MITEIPVSAGTVLAAADALRRGQQTFTAGQVAYLMHLAYDSGRTAAYFADLAEFHCTWADRPFLRRTYEQRVAVELAEMDRAARARAAREGRPYRVHPGGPVDWHTGRPLRHLAVAA